MNILLRNNLLLRHHIATTTAIAYIFLAVFSPGCANIQAPMGGAKDTIPPVLIKANPDENTINFKGNIIKFEFDEYIKLENLNENLVINPPSEKFPEFKTKLRNVSVKLLDTLLPNTTYTLNFGNAVRDVNENNPLKNFSYSFSTGTYIDSLEVAGKVLDAETGMPDSTLVIMLHDTEADSAVAKKKPRFVTRPNGRGAFRFDHLPAGKFYIFALKDEGMRRYTSNETPFAFNDSLVTAGETDSIILRAFVAEKAPEKKSKQSSTTGKNDKKQETKKLQFANSAGAGGQDLLSPLTLNFSTKITALDSSKISLTDTLFQNPKPFTLSFDSTKTILSFSRAWQPDELYKLVLQKGFAKDSTGLTTTKNDTISFKTKAESEYGTLKIKFSGVEMDRNPVLLFTEGNAVVLSVPITGREYNNKMVKPGQYKLRILYDSNKNGKWDPGNYWRKLQPEFIVPIEEAVNIKARWDNEVEIRI